MPSDQMVFFATAGVLVILGLASMSFSLNLIKTVISFQVVVFGANLALFSSGLGGSQYYISQTFVLFSIFVGACVEAVALVIIVNIHRKYGTLNPWEIRRLRH